MQRAFKAVPLGGFGSIEGSASILAATDFDALMQAKRLLGDAVPFDLSEGKRLVVTYRPTQAWTGVRRNPQRIS